MLSLDIHQQLFVQAPIQPRMTLWAGAGSGKTTSIIGKIAYHHGRKELNAQLYRKEYGGSEFIILTFSRAACESFTGRCARNTNLGVYCERNFNVFTFHALAWILYHRQCSRRENNIRFDEAFYEILRLSQWNVNDFRNCRIIFVDEAQDTNDIQYKFILRFAREIETQYGHSVSVVMIGDPNQTIFQFQGGSDRYLIEHARDYPQSQLKLVYNYRSTPEIVAFANAFRPFTQISPMQPRQGFPVGRSRKPTIHPVWLTQLRTQLIDNILDAVDRRGIALEDIAIISPVRVSSERYDERSMRYTYQNMGLYMVLAWLRKHPRINVLRTCAPGLNNHDRPEPRKGYINLLTIHGSKGLEFKKVILLNFHIQTMGQIPRSQEYNNFEYLWYVGVSRACQELDIYCDRNKDTWSAPLLDMSNRHLFNVNMTEGINIFWNSLRSYQDIIAKRHDAVTGPDGQRRLLNDWTSACHCGCGAPNTNHGVTDVCRLIKNTVPTSPDDFIFTLRDYFHFDVTIKTIPSLYNHNFIQSKRKHNMPNFWGMYFENVFVYFNAVYTQDDLEAIPFLGRAKAICNVRKIYIPQIYHNILDATFKTLSDSRTTTLSAMYHYHNSWTSLQRQLYDYLLFQLDHQTDQPFFPVKSRSLLVPEFQPNTLMQYRNALLNRNIKPEHAYRDIYHLTWIMFGFIEEYPCFYCEHQREYELRPYTWDTLYAEVRAVRKFIERLHADYHVLKFNHHITSPINAIFPIVGEADGIICPKIEDEGEDAHEILELKYISHVNIEHYLQTILYSYCYHGLDKLTSEHRTQIVNIQSGEVYHVQFNGLQFWKLVEWICEKSHGQYMLRHCIIEARPRPDLESESESESEEAAHVYYYEHTSQTYIPDFIVPYMYRPLLVVNKGDADTNIEGAIRITSEQLQTFKQTSPCHLYSYALSQLCDNERR